jgi:hypothetical protein
MCEILKQAAIEAGDWDDKRPRQAKDYENVDIVTMTVEELRAEEALLVLLIVCISSHALRVLMKAEGRVGVSFIASPRPTVCVVRSK